jgi:hypothetical protein
MDSQPAAGRANSLRFAIGLGIGIALLTACGGPMDQTLNTGSTQQVYRASLDPIVAKMTPHERDAFDWAVQGIPDVASLHARYPNASPRAMIRARVAEVRSTYPRLNSELEAMQQALAPIRKDLEKVTASNGQFSVEKDFFGLQPKIRAVVDNGSSRPISRLQWRASLYLDDAKTPVATTVLHHDFRNNGGFRPKQSFTSTFTVGFVRGDETWTTLEIRNAKQRHVTLEPMLDSIRDFGDRLYLAEDPDDGIKKLQELHSIAEKYSDI